MIEKTGISPGTVFVFPGTRPMQPLRQELRNARLRLLEPIDRDEAHSIFEDISCDLVLIEEAGHDELLAALTTVAARVGDGTPVLVFAGPDPQANHALEMMALGATDVLSSSLDPTLALAKIAVLLRLKRRLDAALELSVRDELTGLYNRRFFFERLEQEVARTKRTRLGISLILFDLDHFKKVNDTFGHPVGDSVLRIVARTAERHTRKSDLVARLGGDEFALLLSSNTIDGARVCAEGLRERLRHAEVDLPEEMRLTASFGIACYPHPLVHDPMSDLVRESDKALLRAKALGRDQVVIADVADSPHALVS